MFYKDRLFNNVIMDKYIDVNQSEDANTIWLCFVKTEAV